RAVWRGPRGRAAGAWARGVALAAFFCPAADGIRHGHVTGVQTCALPISWKAFSGRGREKAFQVELHRIGGRLPMVAAFQATDEQIGRAPRRERGTNGDVALLRLQERSLQRPSKCVNGVCTRTATLSLVE